MKSNLDQIVRKIAGDEARKMPTFLFVGAGCGMSEKLPEELQLPNAWKLRESLLEAHFGVGTADENLKKFEEEFKVTSPTPDIVWQMLIQKPTKLEDYNERLFKLFNPRKPIPATYYLLARWYLANRVNIAGLATTNFDLQLPNAFEKLGHQLGKRADKDFLFAEVPQDFTYYFDAGISSSRVVQRLHGSLNRPWSIVAGAKRNVTAVANLIHQFQSHEKHETAEDAFTLVRSFLNLISPPASGEDGAIRFPPYEFLKNSLRPASRIIFIGYSFQDRELVKVLSDVISEGKDVILIEPKFKTATEAEVENELRENYPKFIQNGTILPETGESFLERYLHSLDVRNPLIMLPEEERNVLRVGPIHIPGYPSERIIPDQSSAETEFLDPIYGRISFSAGIRRNIVRIVDTGELQRLRQIKQLSFVHLKHHGATHDRFSHSLGVAYLADQVFERSPSIKKFHFTNDNRLAFTIAALIHDIGHGPYGHTMDLVRRKLGDKGGHEDDTGQIYEQIFSSDNSFADLDLALNQLPVSRDELEAMLTLKHDLGLLISNDGCDLDRLDYVIRDASVTISSLSERKVDAESDLRLLIAGYKDILAGFSIMEFEGNPVACHSQKGRSALLAFSRLYKQLYDEVYYGWQNVSARVMLAEAVVEMIRSRGINFEDIKPLTDVELLALLEDFENPLVRELAYLVKYRRLFPIIDDIRIDSKSDVTKLFDIEADEDLVSEFSSVSYHDSFLVARLPPKIVQCHFVEEGSSIGDGVLFGDSVGRPEVLSATDGRIMIFAPPKGKNLSGRGRK